MKKLFALVLALCMVVALCACGQEAAPAAAPAPAARRLRRGASADSGPFVISYPSGVIAQATGSVVAGLACC